MSKTSITYIETPDGNQKVLMEGSPRGIAKEILRLTEILIAQTDSYSREDCDLENMKRDFEQYMRSLDV